MLFFALLLTFFLEATTSEVYEDAMNRQIEDDVLRKFYIDMSPGHTIYEPQSVSGLNLLSIKTKLHRVSTLRTTLTTTLRQSPRRRQIMESTSRAYRLSRSRKFSRFSSFFLDLEDFANPSPIRLRPANPTSTHSTADRPNQNCRQHRSR